MEYDVIRGTNQIGGTIVEIESEQGTKIWVDFGAELSIEEEKSTDRKMIQLMKNKKTRPHAVFFTHIHGDHMGLLSNIPEDVDIFIGEIGKCLLDNIRETLIPIKRLSETERKKFQKEYDLLNRIDKVHFYENKKDAVCKINSEKIHYKALRVDHSAFDSYMLRFEVDGKVLVHTGDYRSHGRLGEALIEDIKAEFTDKPVDILFTEGTMMSRDSEKVMTEEEMQEKATELLKEHPYAFLVCSSINMESLTSFYWAAIHSTENKKAFYCNHYVKKQLNLFTQKVGQELNLWQFKFHRSYQIEKGLLKQLKNGKTQIQHMKDEGFIMLVGTSQYYRELMEKFRDYSNTKPLLIYSMWEGYLDGEKPYAKREYIDMIDMVKAWGFKVEKLHTSGHAAKKTIKEVIEALDPREAIIPIHTENKEGFLSLEIRDDLKSKIKDGMEIPESFAAKNDTRAFKLNSDMMEALMQGGKLHAFVELVQKHEDLELCFRGNSSPKNTCKIYDRNQVFFEISWVNNGPRISFNRDHARYWDEAEASDGLQTLKNKHEIEIDKANKRFINSGKVYTFKEAEEIYGIRKKMMDSYFSEKDTHDYYEPERKVDKKSWKIEKQEQQKLMTANTDRENGYYIYDLEYAQAFVNEDIKGKYKELSGEMNQNKPDALAIRYEKGEPKALVFIELKSTRAAMLDKSGAMIHMFGMRHYVDNPWNKEFIENRKKEAHEMMICYRQLNLHTGGDKGCDSREIEDFSKLPIELLLVITDNVEDSAKACYENYKKKINVVAEKNQCGILCLKPGEFKMKYEDVKWF